jgi:hypothetical protein
MEPDCGEAVRVRVRKWAQQKSIHDAENRGICANADGERRYDHERNGGILAEHPQSVL